MIKVPSVSLEGERAVRTALADIWAAGHDCSQLTDDLLGTVCEKIPNLSREEVLLVLNHIRTF